MTKNQRDCFLLEHSAHVRVNPASFHAAKLVRATVPVWPHHDTCCTDHCYFVQKKIDFTHLIIQLCSLDGAHTQPANVHLHWVYKSAQKPILHSHPCVCLSVCLSVCQADGWARATYENYAYYDDCNPQLVSVVVFLSLLCFRLVILLFYVFIVYLHPCAAHCATTTTTTV